VGRAFEDGRLALDDPLDLGLDGRELGEMGQASEPDDRESGSGRGGPVVVGTRPVNEGLAIRRSEKEFAPGFVEEAVPDFLGEVQGGGEEAFASTRAVEIQAGIKLGGVIVEKSRHACSPLVEDPVETPGLINHFVENEIHGSGRVDENRRVAERFGGSHQSRYRIAVPSGNPLAVQGGGDALLANGA
jgi:hypothetical protein